MAETPWLSIIGLGEDGPEGLNAASRKALEAAEIVMGPPRHLGLLPAQTAQTRIEWPVPFADGIAQLLELRGRKVAVLASGDPFWFGAGSVLTKRLSSDEWLAFPGASSFSLAASRLGWPLENTHCLGLHAAPLERLRGHLATDAKLLMTLRDGNTVQALAGYLSDQGFGQSRITVLECLGGPRERRREFAADAPIPDDIQHPVLAAVEIAGDGISLSLASGRSDDLFENDGQITKRPARALTLSALAPRHDEHLWDIGGGSGSISIEWLLTHPSLQATIVEANRDRADRIRRNAKSLGVDRLQVVEGKAPEALDTLPLPNAVFIGGGLSEALLQKLTNDLPSGTRIVANAVTLESESLLVQWHGKLGGDLLRIDLSSLASIGPKRGWKAAYPLVQWSVTL